MRILVLIFAALLKFSPAEARFDALSLYPKSLEFDVLRDGKTVGQHITLFEPVTESSFSVRSHMRLNVSLLFIPIYGFEYHSEEYWVDQQLYRLDASVSDGGENSVISVRRSDGNLRVETSENDYLASAPLFATNHWHPMVVKETRVLNTLTGKVNSVEIREAEIESIAVEGGQILATRYDYYGDLNDTSVWYDEQGRWVKLRFKAKDGSVIDYRCRTCKLESRQ